MRATCVLTVASLKNSVAAISLLLSPRAISFKTSSSRAVSVDSARCDTAGAAGRANRSTNRRVIDGASSASPTATRRTAAMSCSGDTSFRRNPLAPARKAA